MLYISVWQVRNNTANLLHYLCAVHSRGLYCHCHCLYCVLIICHFSGVNILLTHTWINMEKGHSASRSLCLSPWCWNIQTHSVSPFPPQCWSVQSQGLSQNPRLQSGALKCALTCYLVSRHTRVTSEKDSASLLFLGHESSPLVICNRVTWKP